MSSSKNPKDAIIRVLKEYPEGLIFTSVAKYTGLHRHTATKYIHELTGSGIVSQRIIGMA